MGFRNSQGKGHDSDEEREGKRSVEDADSVGNETRADASEECRCVDDCELL